MWSVGETCKSDTRAYSQGGFKRQSKGDPISRFNTSAGGMNSRTAISLNFLCLASTRAVSNAGSCVQRMHVKVSDSRSGRGAISSVYFLGIAHRPKSLHGAELVDEGTVPCSIR